MLGLAIRISQRKKIHSESANKRCTVLEAEMRRRLWWAMIILDARISEKSDHKEIFFGANVELQTTYER